MKKICVKKIFQKKRNLNKYEVDVHRGFDELTRNSTSSINPTEPKGESLIDQQVDSMNEDKPQEVLCKTASDQEVESCPQSILTDKALYKDGDLFQLDPYLKAFSNIVTECATPMTLSIQGDWGSGKTSFVNLALRSDEIKSKIDFLEFNTWQYSKFDMDDQLIVTLIEKFASTIIPDNLTDRAQEKLKSTLSKFLTRVRHGATKVLIQKASSKVGEYSETAQQIVHDSLENAFLESSSDSEKDRGEESIITIIEDLKNDIDKVMETRKKRLVVFIDDLDRLAPAKALDILEVLQIFLTTKNCVFILAVDYDIITMGFKEKMGESYSSLKSKNFFDKIIQLPFKIPANEFSNEKAERFVRALIDDVQQLSAVQVIDKSNPEGIKPFLEIVDKSIQFNLRQLKRVMNAFWLSLSVANSKLEGKSNNLALFYIICLQVRFDEVYTFLLNNSSNKEKAMSFIGYLLQEFSEQEDSPNEEYDVILGKHLEPGASVKYRMELSAIKNYLVLLDKYFSIEEDKSGETSDVTSFDWELFHQTLTLSGVTTIQQNVENIDEDLAGRSMGAYVKDTITDITFSEATVRLLMERKFARDTFKTSTPVFRDVTKFVGKSLVAKKLGTYQELKEAITKKDILKLLGDERKMVLDNPTNYARYYRDPIAIKMISTDSTGDTIKVGDDQFKIVLLSSQWGDYQKEAYDEWRKNILNNEGPHGIVLDATK